MRDEYSLTDANASFVNVDVVMKIPFVAFFFERAPATGENPSQRCGKCQLRLSERRVPLLESLTLGISRPFSLPPIGYL